MVILNIIGNIKASITQIDNKLSDIANSVDALDAFIKHIEDKADKDINLLYRDTLIAAYIANNNIKIAMRLIENEIKRKSISRFQFGDKSFF